MNEAWDPDQLVDTYKMESNMFDFDQVQQSEFFTVKKYQDSVYLGEVNEQS